jgi:hypothetical protein
LDQVIIYLKWFLGGHTIEQNHSPQVLLSSANEEASAKVLCVKTALKQLS